MSSNGDAYSEAKAALAKRPIPAHAAKRYPTIRVGWLWPLAALMAMTVVPIFVYWSWLCVEYNKGRVLLPANVLSLDSWVLFLKDDILTRAYHEAYPSARAWAVYAVWVVWQALLFQFAPGPMGEGAVLEDGKRLKYKFNGAFAWATTLIAVASLHVSGVFPLTELHALFAPLLTVASLFNYGLMAALYLFARAKDVVYRQTDSIIYDYFMGAELNPKLFGFFDLKYFFELRVGIMHWFFTTCAFAYKYYLTYGTVSTPMALIVFYHLCFVNACFKGEQCVPVTIDIVYEKFGWMLSFLDVVMVPFIFPMQAFYLYTIGPYEHSLPYTLLVAAMHVIGYWMFDTANSQKDYFREEERVKAGVEHHPIPKGFPTLPWDRIADARYIQTERGTKLLVDGWWRYARHMNYLGDMLMSWSWGMTCGFGSLFPYAYTAYLTPLLLHRERRDHRDCKAKYGKDWDRYCQFVPYRIIPLVY